MFGLLSCYACQDTWERELTDSEVAAYLATHPELAEPVRSGKIDELDFGEVLCDGCEDFYRDEAALADAEHLDDTDGNFVSWLCGDCGDPAYDCECDVVIDGIDRKAYREKHERL